MLTFSSIEEILTWFFNRKWIKPPPDARSIELLKVHTNPRITSVDKEMTTYFLIQSLVERLSPRDWVIMRNEFILRGGKSQTEIAYAYCLEGGDRSVRYIRDKLLKRLEREFLMQGVLSPKVYEKPNINHEKV